MVPKDVLKMANLSSSLENKASQDPTDSLHLSNLEMKQHHFPH
jgi:hypothetical protein